MSRILTTPIRRHALCYALLILPIVGEAQLRPETTPDMRAVSLDVSPSIDGDVLGDNAWAIATPATGFWQVRPDDGQAATQRTEVYVGFTRTALYVGVVAYDDNPDGIIVADSRRDSDVSNTDAFLFIVDGLQDGQNGYVFGTNAASIEYDGQVTGDGSGGIFGGGGFNLNWDGTWRVRSKIGDFGWSAEFEIPFKTLRYGSGDQQDWGINFQRNIRRNNEVAFWAPLERNRNLYRVSDAGTLRDVVPPAQRNLKVTPYMLGRASRGGGLDGTRTDEDLGFDLKYSITPSLTLDLTYNTDFAQVEVDEQQINLDRFNLFFPEKRSFFLENSGLFSVGTPRQVELFFSRRIGISADGEVVPVAGGARLSGKIGERTNVGLLHMATESVDNIAAENRFTVARISQELPNRSAVGALITSRDGDANGDDYNRAFALDGRWGIGDDLTLEAWLAKTDTPGLDGNDDAFNIEANYSSTKWLATARYTEVGEDFNPEIGFLSRSNYRHTRAFVMRVIRPDDLWGLLELRPHVSYTGFWNFDGFHETGFLHIDNHFVYKTGTEFHTAINFTKSGVIDGFEIVDGVFIEPATYDHSEVQFVYFTDASKPVSFELRTTIGGRFGGDRVSISPAVSYRIGETFRSELSVNYNDFDLPVTNGEFTVNLARLRLSYSFTPKIQLQALMQYNDRNNRVGTNIRFSWLQSANSGLYLVYNEVNERDPGSLPTGRELILKYSHIFDVFD